MHFPFTDDPIIALKALNVANIAAAQNGSIGIFDLLKCNKIIRYIVLHSTKILMNKITGAQMENGQSG